MDELYKQLSSGELAEHLDLLDALAKGQAADPAALGALRVLAPDLFGEGGELLHARPVPVLFSRCERQWLADALWEPLAPAALPAELRRALEDALPPPTPGEQRVLQPFRPKPPPHNADAQAEGYAFFLPLVLRGGCFAAENHTGTGAVRAARGRAWRIEHMAATGLLYLLFYDFDARGMVLARLDRLRDWREIAPPAEAARLPELADAYERDAQTLAVRVANRHNAAERFCTAFNAYRRATRYLPGEDAFEVRLTCYSFERETVLRTLMGFGPLVKVLEPAELAEELCRRAAEALAAIEERA